MKHSRSFRVVRFVLLALLGAEAFYLAGANAFLSFGGIQAALRSTDDFRVSFRRAWTFWPGTVHVRGARILFQDHNLEWSLDAERLEADLAFRDVLSKTIHATRVRGEGAAFRVRQRVVAADATLPSTRALPPIPEYPTPALVPAYVPAAPRTDLWRVHLEDVDVGVVEVWAQQLRYLGRGRARGAFRLHAGHHLWVGPASLDLEPGQLVASERVLAGRFFGHVECVVHPLFVNEPVGRELFRNISARIDLHGEDVRLGPLDLFLPGLSLSSPGARLDVALTADHGVIASQSRIELRGPVLRGRYGEWTLASRAFELDASSASDGLGQARFTLEDAAVSRGDGHGSSLTLGNGTLALATSSVDTSADWGLARVDVGLSKLEIPVLAALDDLVKPHGIRLQAGSARVDATGRYSGSSISGEARARLSKARGRVLSARWELDGSAELSLSRVGIEALAADSLDLAVAARRLAVASGATSVEATDAHVTGRVRLEHGRGAAHFRTTARALAIGQGRLRVTGKAHADLELSAIDLGRKTLEASATGELASFGASSGPGARGRARRVGLEAEFSVAGTKVSRGWLDLSFRSLSARAGVTALSADARVFAEARDLDIEKRRGTASAVLLLDDLVVRDAVDGAKCQFFSASRAALRSQLSFSPLGRARVEVVGELEKARATWDDFEVGGDARLVSRYLESSSDITTFDLVATALKLKSGGSASEGWEANIPALRVLSTLRRDQGRFSGPLSVRASRFAGRIGRAPLHAALSADVRFSSVDLRRREALGSGSVHLTQVDLAAGPVRIEQWWGKVSVPLLRVAAEQNLEAFGTYQAELRDGLPILALFAASGDLPGWVPRMFPLAQLEARGRFRRSCRTTDLVIERASGGPLALAGRIQSTPTDERGAVLLELQTPVELSAGLAIYEGSVGVSALAGNDWLSRQSATLDGWEVLASCVAPPDSCKLTKAPH